MFQEIHNTTEDMVFNQVTEICDLIEKEGSAEKLCTCPQCRSDTACYVLNRSAPRYVTSNRGVVRVGLAGVGRQQFSADIVSMVWEGLRQVNHNQRPVDHADRRQRQSPVEGPVYNLPAIVGRILNGINFEPLSGISVELRREGNLVKVRDKSWQNPYTLVANTEGTFAFWPSPVSAESPGLPGLFEYSIRVEMPGFETLNHFFSISVTSEQVPLNSYSMARTHKLQDLYLFPPGGDENVSIRE